MTRYPTLTALAVLALVYVAACMFVATTSTTPHHQPRIADSQEDER